jgi:hypothetical protein
MGAWLGYEVAVRLETSHGTALRRLFVSGQYPPQWPRELPDGIEPTDDELLAAIPLAADDRAAARERAPLRVGDICRESGPLRRRDGAMRPSAEAGS